MTWKQTTPVCAYTPPLSLSGARKHQPDPGPTRQTVDVKIESQRALSDGVNVNTQSSISRRQIHLGRPLKGAVLAGPYRKVAIIQSGRRVSGRILDRAPRSAQCLAPRRNHVADEGMKGVTKNVDCCQQGSDVHVPPEPLSTPDPCRRKLWGWHQCCANFKPNDHDSGHGRIRDILHCQAC